MTLPASGPISLSQVNTELGRPATNWITMNDPDVRRLAGAPSGAIYMSFLYGKSNIIREPASGTVYQQDVTQYREGTWTDIWWGGTHVISVQGVGYASLSAGGYTYYSGWNLQRTWGGWYFYDLYRTRLGP